MKQDPANADLPTTPSRLPEVTDGAPIKRVPGSETIRRQLRDAATEVVADLDKSEPLDRTAIESLARSLLDKLDQPEDYLGWTMVIIGSAFWRDQVTAIPYHRRLLLLPHCLRNADECPAEYNEVCLECQDCGACELSDLRAHAEQKGCRVLIAEGSPVVMQIIIEGHADSLLGVSCLNVLEKSLEKVLAAGIPCMAVPLLSDTCRNTRTDLDWVREMIDTPYRPAPVQTRTHIHLLRCAAGMFDPEELDRLVPRLRGGPTIAEGNGQGLAAIEPIASTEAIARDFLIRGGKHARPFVTLAAYDAMTGGCGSRADGAEHVDRLPDAVKRVSLAIEVFHKASLVHDDIEDDDLYRYGRTTLHRKYGTSMAINVGDYLIGLGYKLVGQQRGELGADVVADILAQLAEAHTKLCEGQGAELAWRDAHDKSLTPLDALKIYALKTAPAFEAALYAGLRLAGTAETYRRPTAQFTRHLGIAFQILNDLDDWQATDGNKRINGTDVLGRRPTLLWALAMENLDAEARRRLGSLAAEPNTSSLDEARRLYQRGGVFRNATELVAKHHQRAREVADRVQPTELRLLLHYLADSMLHR